MITKSDMRMFPNGSRYWGYSCKLHRVDGPAVIYLYPDGKEEYWLHNIQYSSLEEMRRILTMDEALK